MEQLSGIKNIIFDFGGVIIDIDFNLTYAEFKNKGIENIELVVEKAYKNGLFAQFEKGIISPDIFRDELDKISGKSLPVNEFNEAWNALLLDIPVERIQLLEKLKKNYNIFLLSNTNIIHYQNYINRLYPFGYKSFNELFHYAYFSHEISMIKPDVEIYNYVLNQQKLKASETLFVDDLEINCKGAERVGVKSLNIKPGRVLDYF